MQQQLLPHLLGVLNYDNMTQIQLIYDHYFDKYQQRFVQIHATFYHIYHSVSFGIYETIDMDCVYEQFYIRN